MTHENESVRRVFHKEECPILFFPIVSKSFLNDYLDGFIFHPYFHHRFVDNWLGYFASKAHQMVCLGFSETLPASGDFCRLSMITRPFEFYDFPCCTGACWGHCHRHSKRPHHTRNSALDEYDALIMNLLLNDNASTYSEKPQVPPSINDRSIGELNGLIEAFIERGQGRETVPSKEPTTIDMILNRQVDCHVRALVSFLKSEGGLN